LVFDFALVFLGVIPPAAFAKSGASNSKLGPADGVLDPVLDAESIDGFS
jgi:hypothetical protein